MAVDHVDRVAEETAVAVVGTRTAVAAVLGGDGDAPRVDVAAPRVDVAAADDESERVLEVVADGETRVE